MDNLVSVVIPIYNVEKYLNECIKSVVNQTYSNLEIILVNDGSQDNCPKICDSWAKKDNRIKVIHKTNAGLGMARNTGIDNANGKYICFVDSDDFIELSTIEQCINTIKNCNSQIVVFGYNRYYTDSNSSSPVIPIAYKTTYTGNTVIDEFLYDFLASDSSKAKSKNLAVSSCFSFYDMNLIQSTDWRFVSERDILSEDTYSMIKLFKNVNSVAILEKALYYYRENTNSLSNSYRSDRFIKNHQFYLECKKLCEALEYPKNIFDAIKFPYIANTIGAIKLLVFSSISFKSKINELTLLFNNETFKEAISSLDTNGSIQRKILIKAMKNKLSYLTYFLVRLKK